MTGTAKRIERKYALTRIKAGDWLLPSNDGKTIFRLATYIEGPSSGLDHMDRDREFWGVWRWLGDGDAVDTEDWTHWDFCEGFHEKRDDAIQSALKLGGAS